MKPGGNFKRRRCVLCESNKAWTDAPKDKAVCHECAAILADGDWPPKTANACSCICHSPGHGEFVLHASPCCWEVMCPHCGLGINSSAIVQHIKNDHATLLAWQAGEEP